MTQHLCLCPLCGEGSVHETRFDEPFEYKGKTITISLHCKECDVCGSEFSDAATSKKNQRVINAAKKQIDKLLDSDSIARLRKKWNVTQVEAGRIFGGGPVAFSKYESDDVVQSEAMDKLLRVADAVPEARHWLLMHAGLTSKKSGVDKNAGDYISLLGEALINLHSSVASSGAMYTIDGQDSDIVVPVIDPGTAIGKCLSQHPRFARHVLVKPTVRRYRDEENQSYLHRPKYSEQEYALHSI